MKIPASAQEQQGTAALRTAVFLLGANSANDSLSMNVPSGALALDLNFQINRELKVPMQGLLMATNFTAQTAPADVVTPALSGSGEVAGTDRTRLSVRLDAPGMLHVKLLAGTLRPSTTYKGWLFLTAGDMINRWELTLTTGARGILAAEPVGTLKFITCPPFARSAWLSGVIYGSGTDMGSFPITLRDKSAGGPYHNIRVRFEPSGPSASKAITSNFSLDTFSFWTITGAAPNEIDLQQRDAESPGGRDRTSARKLDIGNGEQRTLTVLLKPLSPGEYSGALKFGSDESADDAAEAKLPIVIQVRHHWSLPVLIIIIGSFVGWFGSKYVVAAGKARDLARQVRELRVRADFLARPDPPRSGWSFPGEATSYRLARVRVLLSQLTRLASSSIPILLREDDIRQQRQDAELRLSALETLRSVRLRVQQVADGRPAAQLTLGRLLRSCYDIVERPTFAQAQQTDLTNLLQSAEAWLAPDTFNAKYRESLIDRLQSHEIPYTGKIEAGSPVGGQLEALLKECPAQELIRQDTTLANLEKYDVTIAKIALLWRERRMPWAMPLANACADKKPLEELFRLVDDKFWEELKTANEAKRLKLALAPNSQGRLLSYDLVEVLLTSEDSNADDSRMLYHPMRVGWSIMPPDGNDRSTETHGLTLVQYFPNPGKVSIKASLRWHGPDIVLRDDLQIEIVSNPEYLGRRMFGGGFTEWAAIAIATGFAAVTAIATQYDSTFGSFSQYLTLFIWAAGAGTGGNIFKQLGSASAPGGQPEATLPSATGGAGGK